MEMCHVCIPGCDYDASLLSRAYLLGYLGFPAISRDATFDSGVERSVVVPGLR